MFGYVCVDEALLSKTDLEIYHGVCNGISLALMHRYGATAKYTLSYDMAAVALLLSSIYGVGFEEGYVRASTHPTQKQKYLRNEIVEYAADMNIILTYKNALGSWQEERNPVSLATAAALKSDAISLCSKYPRQCSAFDSYIEKLYRIESGGEPSPQMAAEAFGGLVSEAFIWQEDALSLRLRAFGYALGKAVYIMNAAVCLKEDLKRERYNPLGFYRGEREKWIEQLVEECRVAYSKLDVSEYDSIFNNIFHSGIWVKYRYMLEKERRRSGRKSV